MARRFDELAGDTVAVQAVSAVATVSALPAASVPSELRPAEFDRDLDRAWRRTSYSGLTRDAHDAGPVVSSEADAPVKDDEPDLGDTSSGVTDALSDVESPMGSMPAGAAFGTLVHEVLELADLSEDPEQALREAAVEKIGRSGVDVGVEDLVAGLMPAVSTPLGPLASDHPLRDIPLSDQLRELDFELPLAGGDHPTQVDVRLRQVGDLLRTHLADDDPVRPYADVLAAGGFGSQQLRGYLAGSIDVVLRVDGRFVVVDHKTNRLAPRDELLTAHHYRREALDAAMIAANYPLQALLYAVALHRFLRWRQPAYDPTVHLGGVLYLFLRGMCGPGVEAGIWSWRPPAALVVEVSNLFAGVKA